MRFNRATATDANGGHLQQLLFVCCLCLGPVSGALAQELLLLSFSEGLPAAGRYSTQATLRLSVVDGQAVILQRGSGRDYQLQASGADWTWTQVEQVPRNSTSLKITPERRADEVLLQISYASKDGDDTLSYTSTVVGKLGEWIPLLAADEQAGAAGTRHYSTAAQTQDLAVRVDPATP